MTERWATYNERFTSGEIASLSWRSGGSSPAESDMRTRTVVARRTCSVSRCLVVCHPKTASLELNESESFFLTHLKYSKKYCTSAENLFL